MRRGLLTCFLVLSIVISVFAIDGTVEAKVLDRIVANVNGDIITLREVNDRLEPLIEATGLKTKAEITEARKRILNGIIDQRLTEQEAQRLGISVSEEEVTRAINHIKTTNNVNDQQLAAKLAEKGGTLTLFRNDVRSDILRSKLIGLVVRSSVVVPDEEVIAYIKKYGSSGGESFTAPTPGGRVRLRNITIPLPAGATQESARVVYDELMKIKKEVESGLDFKKAAIKYSEAPNAKQGGDLGVIAWTDMNESLKQVLGGLNVGEVSQPVVMGTMGQIFQVVEKIDSGEKVEDDSASKDDGDIQVSPEEMERVRNQITDRRLKEKYEDWVQELRSNAVIEVNL